MPTIMRDGVELYYDSFGSGPPVLLHHALVVDNRSWQAIGLLSALEKAGFRSIVFDAAGHGRSDDVIGLRNGLSERVADALAVADVAAADRFHYVGYSMGGWVGTGLASQAPQRIASMFIAGWDPIDGARRVTNHDDTPLRNEEFEGVIRAIVGDQKEPSAERKRGYITTYERLFRDLPSFAYLMDADFPLRMAIGEKDPYAPSVSNACEALWLDCPTLPGDHVSAFLAPEFVSEVTAWLTRCEGH